MTERKQQVRHDAEQFRFSLEIDGLRCLLEYRREGDQLITLHTLVPPELRGRGLAEVLTRAALDYARTHSLRVVPQCSYTAAFLQRHPELAS